MSDTINRVIVPGTFDPITFGHIDVIRPSHLSQRDRRCCRVAGQKRRGHHVYAR